MYRQGSKFRVYKLDSIVPQKVRNYQYKSYDIYSYGFDNVYPQKVEQIKLNSGKTSDSVDLFQKFIYGLGFKETALNTLKVNDKGETLRHVLKRACEDYALFKGYALHFTYNLLGQIVGISNIPYSWLRLGDKESEHAYQVAMWDNWGEESKDNIGNTQAHIKWFEMCRDLTIEEFRMQVSACGGFQNFDGNVMYYSEKGFYEYPYASFDAVLEDCKTDAQYQVFRQANINNNFDASKIIRFFGDTTAEDEDEIRRTIQDFQGAENSGNVLLLFGNQIDGDGNPVSDMQVEDISDNSKHDLYEKQEKSVKTNIISRFMQPNVLHNLGENGIFNNETIQEAYTFYNHVTRMDRLNISETFEKVLERSMWSDITDNYEIQENEYVSKTDTIL